jgi:hypothetical protein
MKIRHPSIILLAIFGFCGCSPHAGQSIESMEKALIVPAKTFLAVTNGMSLSAVRDTFGIAARHEFTASSDEREYILISCLVGMDDNIDDSLPFCMLFRDNILIKLISPVPAELEEYPYEETTATRVKPWDIEDTKRVMESINAPALTHAQIIDDLRPYKGPGMERMSVLPAFLLTGYFGK